MSRINDIESEVRKLSPEELEAFRNWFQKFDNDNWDRQIEADARAGRLDSLADEALRRHNQGDSSEL